MSGADERARHEAATDERVPREADADRQARLRFDASLPDHAARNRAWWDADSERYQAVQGQQLREAGGVGLGRLADPRGGAAASWAMSPA